MISVFRGLTLVGDEIELAASFGKRFAGLMFRKRLNEGGGMLLIPCSSVHMCFMKMPLDVVYLDGRLCVLAVEAGLKPWRVGKIVKGAKAVLELPSGAAERYGLHAGIKLRIAAPENADERKGRVCNGTETANNR